MEHRLTKALMPTRQGLARFPAWRGPARRSSRTLLNRDSGRAVSIWATDTADGADAVQWVENNGSDQQWQLVPVGSYYEVRARHSGELLTVSGGSTADGAQVIQWPDQDLPEQQWSLIQVSG
jgi:hypothetical protein